MKNNKLKPRAKSSEKDKMIAEPLGNIELHEMEDIDSTKFDYPGSDEPVALPDWPKGVCNKPYKM